MTHARLCHPPRPVARLDLAVLLIAAGLLPASLRAGTPAAPAAGALTLEPTTSLLAPGWRRLASSAALTTVDQQNTTGSGGVIVNTVSTGLGQSFTPAQATMNAATFSLEANTGSGTVQLYVYAGNGFGGTLLATGTPVTLTNRTIATVELPLASPLVLTPGSQYTLRVFLTDGSYLTTDNPADSYAGGNLFKQDGSALSGYDLVFAEGTDAALPEPSTWAGGALLVGAAGRGLRRRLNARAGA